MFIAIRIYAKRTIIIPKLYNAKNLFKFYSKAPISVVLLNRLKAAQWRDVHNRMNTPRPNELKHFLQKKTQSVYNELFFYF